MIANKKLFFAVYWHLFKETTLEPKHLSALLLEIRYQQLPIFYGSELDALLTGRKLNENDNVTIFLKEAAIEQIFTGYSIKRSLRPNFEQETFVDKDKKFWPEERAMIRENLQKHAELLLKKQVFA